MKILVVEMGKHPAVMEIADSLEAMQQIVGGSIQAVYPFDEPVALICNDEGKLPGLPLNRCLRHPENHTPYDLISGTFFLCGAPPDAEHFVSLTEQQIARYYERFEDPEIFLNVDGKMIAIAIGMMELD